MKKQDFKVLKTKDLYPFPDNPFHVVEDETLSELAESIKEFGIVTPIITRPKEDGNGYEVIAGQRRVRASELAGINTVPAFVLPLDRDRAIIILVDSNLQRENILPSERAFAYKMKSEAMKRQGFRTDLTSSQVVTKLRTDDKVVPFPVSWTVKMKKKQKETQDILSYHTQAAGCSDKARAKASGGRQPIEECGRTGL